jgi:hypothetical protein
MTLRRRDSGDKYPASADGGADIVHKGKTLKMSLAFAYAWEAVFRIY